jgi:predicted methyltransferase
MSLPRRSAAVGVAVLLLAAPPAFARSSDGATSHRRFDDPAYWSTVFDDPARAAWQKPEALVAALGLRPGQCVADLGAGTGYFSRLLSAAVGPAGTVLAVDPEPNLVAHLRARAEREGSANVVPVLASLDNPRLPAGQVDVVLIVDTYHHIDNRVAYFRRLRQTLRPPGRIAIVDWQKRPLPVGPEMEHKLAREQVVHEMETAGYRLAQEPSILPYQYFLIFEPH